MIAEEQQTENGVGVATFPLTNFMHCKPTKPGRLEGLWVRLMPVCETNTDLPHILQVMISWAELSLLLWKLKYGLNVGFYVYRWDPNGKGRILP